MYPVFTLTNFSSLAATEVVNMKIPSAASECYISISSAPWYIAAVNLGRLSYSRKSDYHRPGLDQGAISQRVYELVTEVL